MVATTDLKSLFLTEFERSLQDAKGVQPAWLLALRREALRSFEAQGFPTRHDEEWRFTPLSGLLDTPFVPAGIDHSRPVDEEQFTEATTSRLYPSKPLHRLVLLNGRTSQLDAKFAIRQDLPERVVVASLAEAISTHPQQVQPYLGQLARYDKQPFTALNTAFIEDGFFVYIPRNVVVETPILLLHVTNTPGEPIVSHPRTLIVAEEGGQATIIESFVGAGETTYFTNAVTEIAVGANAQIDHVKLNYESREAFHIATSQIELQRDARFTSHSFTLGGEFVRNDINAGLRDENIVCTLNGLYLGRDRQLVDNHTAIDHAMPHCESHELYKGILDGRARGVFNGKIFVRLDAQKTDAKQTNQTLLLSDQAQINTKPQLEIFANDVKCTHGATVGQLSAEAVFYLRSRGIGQEEARALLTYAFANDLINRVPFEPVREALERDLLEQLARQ